jgi:hypothetical protein
MGKFVIHRVTPKSRALILGAPSSLEPKPRPLWTLHIPPPGPWLIVEGKVCTAFLTMGCKVKFWNHPCNDLVIQIFSIVEREFLQSLAEVNRPLAHNVV